MNVFPVALWRWVVRVGMVVSLAGASRELLAQAALPFNPPVVAPASGEAELALKKFRVAPGLKVDLFAAEPLLANPVAICTDEQGRWYVAETYRLHKGVTDIRAHMNWLDEELAARTTADLAALLQRHGVKRLHDESERVRLVQDRDGDGRADHATIFAEGFNTSVDGLAAGVLARKGDVYFANIPHLWLLRDRNGDGVAEVRQSLHYGFGVRSGFIGHDLHGLRMGPDGRLYFSIGDRGFNVQAGGRDLASPESGAVLRCEPDGSGLEIFATGLRNPQELAFDEHGNLFTGDNNSDGGDQARWVYLVEGGDSGWRIGWQFIERPNSRGPWNQEKLWHPEWDGQAAYLLPPIANLGNGPAGLTFYPGTGLPERYRGHFFLADFRGASQGSGVHAFTVRPKGAGFELVGRQEFIWNILATDVEFGVDGGLYVSDWVEGWGTTGKGRLYRVHDPALDRDPLVLETRRLLAEDLSRRRAKDLAALLEHADQRVRMEAQFALAARGAGAVATFVGAANRSTNRLARLHAIWGLGQVGRGVKSERAYKRVWKPLVALLTDADAEVRAQAAKVLGELKALDAVPDLVKLLADPAPRPRFFAAMALGKTGGKREVPAVLAMLRDNADKDRYLRHAGVMALAGIRDVEQLETAGRDASPAVRMAALLALRRLGSEKVAMFLNDADPRLVTEAARAINDVPIARAEPHLASLGRHPHLLAMAAREEVQTALLRRVVNANFRLGGAENAEILLNLVTNGAVPAGLRAEAVQRLGQWARPSGRDAVVGLWRPLPARDPSAVAELAASRFEALLAQPEEVQAAAAQMAGQLRLRATAPTLLGIVQAEEAPTAVRVEALKALAEMKSERVWDALNSARGSSKEALRKEAGRLQARFSPAEALAQLRAVTETGSLSEKQAAFATLAGLNESGVDGLLSEWLDKVLAGQVPAGLVLDILDAAKQRQAPEIAEKLRTFENRRNPNDPLRSYLECLEGGDAAEGRRIFYERADVSCFRCHKINGEGGEVGPDLTGLGGRADRRAILESIAYPNAAIAPGFESITVVMKNGTSYAGALKSESAAEMEILSPEDGLVKVKKADIQEQAKGLSAMPEEIRQVLSRQDLRNLVEFLSGLK
ncbi:MAG TPA: PVC-type heme-binding CxxCH protein [Methylomirabilota bacterium]|nr:PVC-type heme-binding CxxCH protein [Methylomirabilota bacterium]